MATRRELKKRVWKVLSLSADAGMIRADLEKRLQDWGASDDQIDRIMEEVQRHFARLSGEMTESERHQILDDEAER